MHLFLSPHLDDVVLSCGATIARLKQQGERVVILTVMAGEPPDTLPDTPLVRALQERLSDIRTAVVTRRAEDAKAATCLGVQVYHLAMLDSTYRMARAVDGALPLYPEEASQHGDIHTADDARVLLLATPLPFTEKVIGVYAPLAVGNHVDHQMVRDWGLVLGGPNTAPTLRFYAEHPYVSDRGALERALRVFTDMAPALKLEAETMTLDESDIDAKLKAVRCYESRVNRRWPAGDQLETTIRDWLLEAGGGAAAERYWRVVKETAGVATSADR